MKSLKFPTFLVTFVLLGSTMAHAADESNPRGEGRRGKGGAPAQRGQMMNADSRVEQLDKALTLTADQKTKIKEIYTKSQEEMRSLMRDAGKDRSSGREKMQELMRSTREQVRAVLTDEQKAKFDKLPQQRSEGQRGGRDSGEGTRKRSR